MRTPEQKQRRREQEQLRRLGLYTGKEPRKDFKGIESQKEYQKKYMAKRRKETPEKCQYDKKEKAKYDKIHWLKYRYGLTVEEYEMLYKQSGGVCPICKQPFVKKELGKGKKGPVCGKGAVIDHNHETGNIRGIICHNCNTAIGNLKDDYETILRAAEWIKNRS